MKAIADKAALVHAANGDADVLAIATAAAQATGLGLSYSTTSKKTTLSDAGRAALKARIAASNAMKDWKLDNINAHVDAATKAGGDNFAANIAATDGHFGTANGATGFALNFDADIDSAVFLRASDVSAMWGKAANGNVTLLAENNIYVMGAITTANAGAGDLVLKAGGRVFLGDDITGTNAAGRTNIIIQAGVNDRLIGGNHVVGGGNAPRFIDDATGFAKTAGAGALDDLSRGFYMSRGATITGDQTPANQTYISIQVKDNRANGFAAGDLSLSNIVLPVHNVNAAGQALFLANRTGGDIQMVQGTSADLEAAIAAINGMGDGALTNAAVKQAVKKAITNSYGTDATSVFDRQAVLEAKRVAGTIVAGTEDVELAALNDQIAALDAVIGGGAFANKAAAIAQLNGMSTGIQVPNVAAQVTPVVFLTTKNGNVGSQDHAMRISTMGAMSAAMSVVGNVGGAVYLQSSTADGKHLVQGFNFGAPYNNVLSGLLQGDLAIFKADGAFRNVAGAAIADVNAYLGAAGAVEGIAGPDKVAQSSFFGIKAGGDVVIQKDGVAGAFQFADQTAGADSSYWGGSIVTAADKNVILRSQTNFTTAANNDRAAIKGGNVVLISGTGVGGAEHIPVSAAHVLGYSNAGAFNVKSLDNTTVATESNDVVAYMFDAQGAKVDIVAVGAPNPVAKEDVQATHLVSGRVWNVKTVDGAAIISAPNDKEVTLGKAKDGKLATIETVGAANHIALSAKQVVLTEGHKLKVTADDANVSVTNHDADLGTSDLPILIEGQDAVRGGVLSVVLNSADKSAHVRTIGNFTLDNIVVTGTGNVFMDGLDAARNETDTAKKTTKHSILTLANNAAAISAENGRVEIKAGEIDGAGANSGVTGSSVSLLAVESTNMSDDLLLKPALLAHKYNTGAIGRTHAITLSKAGTAGTGVKFEAYGDKQVGFNSRLATDGENLVITGTPISTDADFIAKDVAGVKTAKGGLISVTVTTPGATDSKLILGTTRTGAEEENETVLSAQGGLIVFNLGHDSKVHVASEYTLITSAGLSLNGGNAGAEIGQREYFVKDNANTNKRLWWAPTPAADKDMGTGLGLLTGAFAGSALVQVWGDVALGTTTAVAEDRPNGIHASGANYDSAVLKEAVQSIGLKFAATEGAYADAGRRAAAAAAVVAGSRAGETIAQIRARVAVTEQAEFDNALIGSYADFQTFSNDGFLYLSSLDEDSTGGGKIYLSHTSANAFGVTGQAVVDAAYLGYMGKSGYGTNADADHGAINMAANARIVLNVANVGDFDASALDNKAAGVPLAPVQTKRVKLRAAAGNAYAFGESKKAFFHVANNAAGVLNIGAVDANSVYDIAAKFSVADAGDVGKNPLVNRMRNFTMTGEDSVFDLTGSATPNAGIVALTGDAAKKPIVSSGTVSISTASAFTAPAGVAISAKDLSVKAATVAAGAPNALVLDNVTGTVSIEATAGAAHVKRTVAGDVTLSKFKATAPSTIDLPEEGKLKLADNFEGSSMITIALPKGGLVIGGAATFEGGFDLTQKDAFTLESLLKSGGNVIITSTSGAITTSGDKGLLEFTVLANLSLTAQGGKIGGSETNSAFKVKNDAGVVTLVSAVSAPGVNISASKDVTLANAPGAISSTHGNAVVKAGGVMTFDAGTTITAPQGAIELAANSYVGIAAADTLTAKKVTIGFVGDNAVFNLGALDRDVFHVDVAELVLGSATDKVDYQMTAGTQFHQKANLKKIFIGGQKITGGNSVSFVDGSSLELQIAEDVATSFTAENLAAHKMSVSGKVGSLTASTFTNTVTFDGLEVEKAAGITFAGAAPTIGDKGLTVGEKLTLVLGGFVPAGEGVIKAAALDLTTDAIAAPAKTIKTQVGELVVRAAAATTALTIDNESEAVVLAEVSVLTAQDFTLKQKGNVVFKDAGALNGAAHNVSLLVDGTVDTADSTPGTVHVTAAGFTFTGNTADSTLKTAVATFTPKDVVKVTLDNTGTDLGVQKGTGKEGYASYTTGVNNLTVAGKQTGFNTIIFSSDVIDGSTHKRDNFEGLKTLGLKTKEVALLGDKVVFGAGTPLAVKNANIHLAGLNKAVAEKDAAVAKAKADLAANTDDARKTVLTTAVTTAETALTAAQTAVTAYTTDVGGVVGAWKTAQDNLKAVANTDMPKFVSSLILGGSDALVVDAGSYGNQSLELEGFISLNDGVTFVSPSFGFNHTDASALAFKGSFAKVKGTSAGDVSVITTASDLSGSVKAPNMVLSAAETFGKTGGLKVDGVATFAGKAKIATINAVSGSTVADLGALEVMNASGELKIFTGDTKGVLKTFAFDGAKDEHLSLTSVVFKAPKVVITVAGDEAQISGAVNDTSLTDVSLYANSFDLNGFVISKDGKLVAAKDANLEKAAKAKILGFNGLEAAVYAVDGLVTGEGSLKKVGSFKHKGMPIAETSEIDLAELDGNDMGEWDINELKLAKKIMIDGVQEDADGIEGLQFIAHNVASEADFHAFLKALKDAKIAASEMGNVVNSAVKTVNTQTSFIGKKSAQFSLTDTTFVEAVKTQAVSGKIKRKGFLVQ